MRQGSYLVQNYRVLPNSGPQSFSNSAMECRRSAGHWATDYEFDEFLPEVMGDVESANVIEFHLRGVKPAIIDIFTASSLGLRDLVRYHLKRSPCLNARNNDGWTGLMYACASHKNNVVSLFVTLGADISVVDNMGRTFLSVAAENGNVKALHTLKVVGLDSIQENIHEQHALYVSQWKAVRSIINLREFGYTPLMIAALQGCNEMVRIFLGFGADTRIKDRNGRTAFDLAYSNGHRTTAWTLKYNSNILAVRDILQEIGLEKYACLFSGITVDALLSFDDDDLKALGLRLLGPRKKVLLAIDEINALRKNVTNCSYMYHEV